MLPNIIYFIIIYMPLYIIYRLLFKKPLGFLNKFVYMMHFNLFYMVILCFLWKSYLDNNTYVYFYGIPWSNSFKIACLVLISQLIFFFCHWALERFYLLWGCYLIKLVSYTFINLYNSDVIYCKIWLFNFLFRDLILSDKEKKDLMWNWYVDLINNNNDNIYYSYERFNTQSALKGAENCNYVDELEVYFSNYIEMIKLPRLSEDELLLEIYNTFERWAHNEAEKAIVADHIYTDNCSAVHINDLLGIDWLLDKGSENFYVEHRCVEPLDPIMHIGDVINLCWGINDPVIIEKITYTFLTENNGYYYNILPEFIENPKNLILFNIINIVISILFKKWTLGYKFVLPRNGSVWNGIWEDFYNSLINEIKMNILIESKKENHYWKALLRCIRW